jgi:hypothetical protein
LDFSKKDKKPQEKISKRYAWTESRTVIGRENGQLLFNGYRVSVLQDESGCGSGWW